MWSAAKIKPEEKSLNTDIVLHAQAYHWKSLMSWPSACVLETESYYQFIYLSLNEDFVWNKAVQRSFKLTKLQCHCRQLLCFSVLQCECLCTTCFSCIAGTLYNVIQIQCIIQMYSTLSTVRERQAVIQSDSQLMFSFSLEADWISERRFLSQRQSLKVFSVTWSVKGNLNLCMGKSTVFPFFINSLLLEHFVQHELNQKTNCRIHWGLLYRCSVRLYWGTEVLWAKY